MRKHNGKNIHRPQRGCSCWDCRADRAKWLDERARWFAKHPRHLHGRMPRKIVGALKRLGYRETVSATLSFGERSCQIPRAEADPRRMAYAKLYNVEAIRPMSEYDGDAFTREAVVAHNSERAAYGIGGPTEDFRQETVH